MGPGCSWSFVVDYRAGRRTSAPSSSGGRFRCSLLQGCPFSPLLVNCIRVGIFLDDRMLYTKGAQAVSRLVEAATAGQEADTAMGFALHPAKLASFQCHVQQREALRKQHAPRR